MAESERVERCGRCRFWKQNSDTASRGACHRYAPRAEILPDFEEVQTPPTWPETGPENWCGEFQLLPAKE